MMETNELTRTLEAQSIPKAALIAYTSEGDKNFLLEIRNIGSHGNMAEGRPITQEFTNESVKGYSERHSSTPYEKVPSGLTYHGSRKGSKRYVQHNPPHKRMIFLSSNLRIEDTEYNLSEMIYEAGEHGIRIYAYKDDMPGKDTLLHVAPFFNVTGSSVCLGSANINLPKNLTYKGLLQYWGEKFWLMKLSHLGGNGNPTRSNLVLIAETTRNKPLDLRELKPSNSMRLKDILT